MVQKSNETTVRESNLANPLNNRPKSGLPSDPSTSINLPGGGSITSDPTKNTGITKKYTDEEIQNRRVGDWYFDSRGNAVVVPNSMTDYTMKYSKVTGANPQQRLSISDYINAGKSAVMGAQMASFVLPGTGGKVLGAVLGFAHSIDKAKETYLNQFLDQDIEITPTFNVIEHDDGTRSIVLDTDKMKDAGLLSGSGIKAYTDRSGTDVSVGDDGTLNIKVSAAFANSDKFFDLQKELKELFPDGLTKEMAESVKDEESGKTLLDQIRTAVIGEEASFYYSAQSITNFKRIAPSASDEALEQALNTQLAGSFDKDKDLDNLDIAVYDEHNNKKEMRASDYLDNILHMSEVERNDYMSSIGSRIQSPDISDDEKVILQAQANALYSASESKNSKYSGMYLKGFMDSVMDASVPFVGRLGNVLGRSELETFETNDFYANTISLASFGLDIIAQQKMSNLAEKGVRAGAKGVGKLLGETKAGNYLKNIDKLAPAGERVVKEAGMSAGQYALRSGTQLATNVLADAGKDGLEYLAHKATGQEYDYLENLTTDIVMDALVTYGPGTYFSAVNADTGYYRRAKNKETGAWEVVRLTGEELAKRDATRLSEALKEKATLTTVEIFFDKNAALQRVALIARAITPDGKTKFRERLRLLGDIRQATTDVLSEFNSREDVAKNWDALQTAIRNATDGKIKNFTQADADYINAKVNRAKFVEAAKGDKGKVMKAVKFYKEPINGVSKDRAKQLDAIIEAAKPLTRNVLDFYKSEGMISDELYKQWTTPKTDKKTGELIEGSAPADNYFPVWSTIHKYDGRDIAQSRSAVKEFRNKEKMYKVKDFENPLNTLGSYVNNVARNVAIQRRAMLIIETASNPNSPIKIASQSKGASVMEDYSLLVKYSPEFEAARNKAVEKARKTFKTKEEWREDNVKAFDESEVKVSLSELNRLQDERSELDAELRKLRSEGKKKFFDSGMSDEEIRVYQEDVDYLKFQISMNKQNQEDIKARIYDETVELMGRQQAKNPWAKRGDFKLDTAAYAEMYVKSALDNAFKSNNPEGAVSVLVAASVEAANPYASTLEIETEAAIRREAVKFRKKVVKKERANSGNDKSKIAAKVDKLMDKLAEKYRGVNGDGKVEEGSMSSFLTTYDSDAPRTIRFYLNGEEQHIELAGDGAEALVAEFYAPEAVVPTTTFGKILATAGKGARALATTKRTLTTAIDVARVMPNLLRDWTRGIIATGGRILLDPDCLRAKALESGKYTEEEIAQINNAFMLVRQALQKSTFTQSLESPKKDIYKEMIRSSRYGETRREYESAQLARKDMTTKEKISTLGQAVKGGFIHYRAEWTRKNWVEKLSTLQDIAETYTRKRAMDTAYYSELAAAKARGESTDEAIKSAMEAAYFYGREATTNFQRRGKLIGWVAQYVPYLSQKFSSLSSLALTYVDNPVGVANSMRACIGAYSTFIALALSNEESRKRYFMLTEYDRANNIIIPLTNDTIVTIPLDDNIAAFLTPYREMIETLYGVDKRAFYLWALDGLTELSPLDLGGFSEGDKFNLRRGLEKMSSELIPTVLLPVVETATGHNWYYGTEIRVDEDTPWIQSEDGVPTAGELTKSSKDSRLLATIANHTNIPQWKLQEYLEVYGGNVGQYVLHFIDGIANTTGEQVGGKSQIDAIFKPFTGVDSDAASNALWDGVAVLKDEKKTLERKIRGINKKIEASTGDEKARFIEEKQKLISDYGIRVSDFLDSYIQAYSITGGLTKSQANSLWYLYDVYDESRADKNSYSEGTVEDYYNDKVKRALNQKTTALAANSGFDKYFNSALGGYNETYGMQALKNSVKGEGTKTMAKIAAVLEDTSDYDNSYTKLKQDARSRMDRAFNSGDYDSYNAIAYQYDMMVLRAAAPYLQEAGLEESLNNYAVMDYLEDWIYVPTDEMVDAKGRWLSKLPEGAEKSKAYKKRFILKAFGLLED